jgi:hypothetical protein
MDKQFELVKNKCLVFSFGINKDDSFDLEINQKYGCSIYSFDPFVEVDRFAAIRRSNPALSKAVKLEANSKWAFYRLGITGNKKEKDLSTLRIQDMISFGQVLEMTGTRNKIIDVFKMDIEGAEVGFLETIDMEYFCKYVKQFVFETHIRPPPHLLFKLEKCFYLFHRDTRFFLVPPPVGPTGVMTEFQAPNGYSVNLSLFKNEIDLATVLFTQGELYFVNLKFL